MFLQSLENFGVISPISVWENSLVHIPKLGEDLYYRFTLFNIDIVYSDILFFCANFISWVFKKLEHIFSYLD